MEINLSMKILKSKPWFCSAFFISVFALFFNSCAELQKPQPIPKEKESFIGIWKSASGFEIEIKSNGISTILKGSDRSHPDYDPKFDLLPGRHPRVIFIGDSVLNLFDPFNYSVDFNINQLPLKDSSGFKMILDGVTFTK